MIPLIWEGKELARLIAMGPEKDSAKKTSGLLRGNCS